MVDLERHAELFGEETGQRLVAVRFGAQVVVHVGETKADAGLVTDERERGGVGASGAGDDDVAELLELLPGLVDERDEAVAHGVSTPAPVSSSMGSTLTRGSHPIGELVSS